MGQYKDRKEYFRKWERKNKRWKNSKRSAVALQWAKDNPERIKEIMRKHNYGITPEQYNYKNKKQNNRCALCGKKETRINRKTGKPQPLSVDHDHKADRVRDLLCGNCNRGLGLFFDSLKTLKKAIKYLKKHKRS